jgi:hypothetical protein
MADVGRIAAPRMVRLVAAAGPGAFDGEIRFHRRLTVLADARPGLAAWAVSLLSVHAPPDTLLEVDDVPARIYDLPRALRALPPGEPMRVEMLRQLASGRDSRGRRSVRRRTAQQIAEELARWERVLGEAKARLVQAHEAAPRVDPVDLAEASRLRNEWRYSVHVDAWERRRRTRREAQAKRGRYDDFLEEFGASSYEDLSTVGTGFGDTRYDVAIREAATVVSMAEQRCHKLTMELEEARRNESVRDAERTADERGRLRQPDLGELDADRADRLVARALADLDDTAYVRPLVIDCVLDALAPDARRRAYDRLVAHARRRQIVLVTAVDEIARWAAHGSPADVALRLDFANVSRSD